MTKSRMEGVKRAGACAVMFGTVGALVMVVAALVVFNIASTLGGAGRPGEGAAIASGLPR